MLVLNNDKYLVTICFIMLKRLDNIVKENLTQEELVKILNVSYVSVCRWGRWI